MSNYEQAPSHAREHDVDQIARLKRAAETRSASCPGRLDPGTAKRDYNGYTQASGLVERERYSGTYNEGLTHLLLVGGFTIGISRGFNKKRVGGEGTPIESVRVSVLPLGNHPAAAKDSSVTLFEVNPRLLNNRREDGAVQPWESFKIGRAMLEEATGTKDMSVSREHLEMTVHNNGTFSIHDTSSGGTQVIGEIDLLRQEAAGGLNEQGKLDLSVVLEDLQMHDWQWTEQSAGRTVITGEN